MARFWQDKVVLITGASSGIGRSLAVALASRGAAVGLIARRADLLNELLREIGQAGGRAIPLVADVTDSGAVARAAESLEKEFGEIDMLIANAGIGATTHAADLDPESVRKVIETNVLGAVNSFAAVARSMIRRRSGHVVAISSLAAYRGLPKSGAYCASKAALSAFFESVRIDLWGTGVKVSIIHPGFIKTPLTANRNAKMPYLMELDVATEKLIHAIEKEKSSFSFPWQLASIVRAARFMPDRLYDRIAARNSFRE
jgi:short-subunit dehydrogenase